MIVAYPLTAAQVSKEPNSYAINSQFDLRHGGEDTAARVWKVVDGAEALVDASEQPGAIFGEVLEDVVGHINVSLGAPRGCTHVRSSGGSNASRYGHRVPQTPGKNPQYLYAMELPGVPRDEADSLFSLPSNYYRQRSWYGDDMTTGDGEAIMNRGKLAARERGGVLLPLNSQKRLGLYGEGYVIEHTNMGSLMTYDPKRFARVAKTRATLAKRQTKKGDKPVTPQHTPADVMTHLAREMFEAIWTPELGHFVTNPTSNWCQYQWRTNSLSTSIMEAHELAKVLRRVKQVRAVYRKWLPLLPPAYTRLKGYGVQPKFFDWCDKQLQFGKKAAKTTPDSNDEEG